MYGWVNSSPDTVMPHSARRLQGGDGQVSHGDSGGQSSLSAPSSPLLGTLATGVGVAVEVEGEAEGCGDVVASASTRVGVLVAEPRWGVGVVDPCTRVAVVLGVGVTDGCVVEATGVAVVGVLGMATAPAATTGSERSGTGLELVAAWSAQAAADVLAMMVTAAMVSATEEAPLSDTPRHRIRQG